MHGQRIPQDLLPLLQDYRAELEKVLPGKVYGVYLVGSIAMGGYRRSVSDIDWVTVLNDPLGDETSEALTVIHEKFLERHPEARRMDGQYAAWEGLRGKVMDSTTCAVPTLGYPRVNGGVVRGFGGGELDAVTGWILKHQGIPVTGPSRETLPLSPEPGALREAMNYNLLVYWSGKAREGQLFYSGEWVEFAVLTLGRIIHTLEQGTIVTKEQGGLYALEVLPPEWHPLLREALRIRKREGAASLYPSRKERAEQTVEFLENMIARYGT